MKKIKSAFILLLVITPVIIFTMNFKAADTNTPAHYYGKYHAIPITDISPNGWLKELLQRQKNGLGLHHAESGYPYNTCLWAGQIPKGGNPSGQSWWPYEQSGYLVDGLYRCGLALNDTSLINLGRRNIDFVLTHPRANGQLGLEVIGGTQWPFSVL